jgi:hypothetical protein
LVRSTWFEVRDLGDRLQFHGRGRGHGVGLCQMGALRMGEEGAAYAEILAYFFPGTELRNGKAGVEAQGGKAATGARGGKSATEAHGGKAATESNGAKTATESNGAKSVVEARGGKSGAESRGGKTATEAHGANTATGARGGKTATESNGAKSVVEAHGAKSVVEARGGKATTEAHGGKTATEAHGGKVAADPRGGHGVDWRGAGGERVEVLSPNPAADARLAALGDALVREIEARVGQPLGVRPQVRVYPSTAAFRDETGEPGWVAASTRGRVIRMQPARLIEPRLRETLKHELLHVWVDRKARPGTPVWFREGVALFLAQPGTALAAGRIDDAALARAPDRATLDRAYEEARSRVRRMVDRHGEATVLGWLATGLPAGE